jgi:hypothetical protein
VYFSHLLHDLLYGHSGVERFSGNLKDQRDICSVRSVKKINATEGKISGGIWGPRGIGGRKGGKGIRENREGRSWIVKTRIIARLS